ncbi:four helix bundle protein [Hydrogenimonas cancrithermarum]|uniref:Four helix bundle protein n=1 Tax=Hydrogenimonas cancrithermarum TaxID=2993563 RepID=A0ABM8FNR6_9BACT|nr:four helix bundle protein [Hydrogenimonas cancrithermarum]BDY13435.1 four helix bundle protein [Hydrogenimonas cancrithermarum]
MKCETLDVWKISCALSSEIYMGLRECRDYGFKDQITRSALSIPSNIAEGVERESDKESWRFLDIAQASAAELKTQVYIGMKIEYIEKIQGKKWLQETDRVHRMIKSLKRSFRVQ